MLPFNGGLWSTISTIAENGTFYQLAVGAPHLNAGGGQRLGCLHAAHDPAHAIAIARHNLDIRFAVKLAQRRQGFSDFHSESFR